MHVLFWVQHLLGTGHLRRAATLAEAMAARGLEVTLASGGPAAPWLIPAGVELVQLPPVEAADVAFTALVGADGRPAGEALLAERRARLRDLLASRDPDVLITEMFPFGRRAFRGELLPLLEAAAARRPPALRLASVRDVLVARCDPARSAWMRDVARAHYDRVLVHTDPDLVPFGLTFPFADDLADLIVSTGYVAAAAPAMPAAEGRDEILVSCGGGRVGAALLRAAVAARAVSRHRERPWRLIAGANMAEPELASLRAELPAGMILEGARADFLGLLANSLLSVSQAGYNTVVEALQLGRPMVLVPFEAPSETEQVVRATRLAERGWATVVRESELTPETLARAIDAAPEAETHPAVRLDGAVSTARLVEALVQRPEDAA